jgi:hypothetical protein
MPERTVGYAVGCQLGLCFLTLLLAALDEEANEQYQKLFKLIQTAAIVIP